MGRLLEINNICKERIASLENYELIEKIIFDEDETEEIGRLLKTTFLYNFSWETVYSLKELISVFLVSCAKYYYNDGEGGFWQSIQNLTGIYESSKRQKIIKAFNMVLSGYNLNKYEDYAAESYKNIAPIIAHSGLPKNLIDNLLNNLTLLFGQNISYNEIADEAIFTCRYASKNVRRYLKTLNKNGMLNDFILDIINIVDEHRVTIDETLSLPCLFQESVIKWCDNKSDNKTFKSHNTCKAPILKYDINANTLFVETPEMIMQNNSLCVWEVFDGKEKTIKKVYGEYIKGQYFFRSSSIIINGAYEIKVRLLNDLSELLKEYALKEQGEFLTFNSIGTINKSKFVLNTGAFILIAEEFYAESSMEIVLHLDGYNLFYQEPTDDQTQIKFKNALDDEISIKIKKPFDFVSENSLMGDNCTFENLDAFSSLPLVQVPIDGEWQLTIIQNETKYTRSIIVENYMFDLSEIIELNAYGKISLRWYNPVVGYKTFKFLYLPNVEIGFEQYFPFGNGYRVSEMTFSTPKDGCILNDNHEIIDKVSILEDEDTFIGYYRYNDVEYKFEYKVKPFKWSFESNDKSMGQPNKKLYLSVKDLTVNGTSFLNFYNNTNDDVFIKFDNHIQTKSFRVRKHSRITINLLELIEFISSSEDNCVVSIEQNFTTICDLCEIRINIAIRNLRYSRLDEVIIFQWDEDGARKNRQMMFRYLTKPYDYFTIPIKDNNLMVYIDGNDERLIDNCIVEIVANKETNIFSSCYKQELVDGNSCSILRLCRDDFSNMCFAEGNIVDLGNAIYTYLTYRFNKQIFYNQTEFDKVIEKLLQYVIKNRIVFGDEIIISNLLEYNLSIQQFNIAVEEMGLYMPILNKENMMKRTIMSQLLDYNGYLYYAYSFIKKDSEQLDNILANGLGFIDKFQDSENYLWAKKHILFPGVDKLTYIKDKLTKLKNNPAYYKKNEEVLILSILVDLVINNNFQNNSDDLKLLLLSSEYIKNLYDSFPRTLIMDIFKKTSR